MKSIFDIDMRIQASANKHISLSIESFYSMSKRYGVPLMDLISLDLWEINYEAYFRTINVRMNQLATDEKNFANTVSKFAKFNKIDTYEPKEIKKMLHSSRKLSKKDTLAKVNILISKISIINRV